MGARTFALCARPACVHGDVALLSINQSLMLNLVKCAANKQSEGEKLFFLPSSDTDPIHSAGSLGDITGLCKRRKGNAWASRLFFFFFGYPL